MTVKMIVAVDRDSAIGWEDGHLPWKISADMKRFKELTTGSTVLMGRKTFESLGRPDGLPNRQNVVLTSDSAKRTPHGVHPVWFKDGTDSLKTFVQAHQACLGCDPGDLWIIGGATVYDEALRMKLVDEIYLTIVDVTSGADVTVSYDLSSWKLFILRQQKDGVKWYLQSISDPQTTDGVTFTFVHLKRTR